MIILATSHFGTLQFALLSENVIEGDTVRIQHGLEITSQKQAGILNGDLLCGHIMFGMHTDFCHGRHNKCLWCEIETDALRTPWKDLLHKPVLRSAESLMANYSLYKATGSVVQSKGVINKPILHNFPLDHVFLPCLHINMGIWNKIFDTPKATFAKSAEEPHMSRSTQAGIMNARIADLQQVIVSKSAFLATLQGQLQEQRHALRT